MMYKCKLQIEANDRKLSNKDGVNFKDLTDLFSKLIKCLGDEAYLFTLVDVENSSYSPALDTEAEVAVDKFNEIHETISQVDLKNLPKDERDYAISLNRILFERGLHITASNTRDEKSIRLSGITKKSIKDHYYTATTITGQVISILGKVELNPHVSVRTGNGFEYSVYVTPEQEIKLSHYYKNAKIRFRIRSKIDIGTGKSLQTNLIDFTPLNDTGFYSAIQTVKAEYGDIFKNIEDSAKLLQNLRNS